MGLCVCLMLLKVCLIMDGGASWGGTEFLDLELEQDMARVAPSFDAVSIREPA